MKTAEEIAARVQALETTKAMILFPPVVLHSVGEEADIVWRPGQILPEGAEFMPPRATMESLNAEIAALTWVLSSQSEDGEPVAALID